MASVFDMPAGEFLDTPQNRSVEQSKSNKEAAIFGPLNPTPPREQAPSNIIYTHSPAAPLAGQGIAAFLKDVGEGVTEAVHGVDSFFKGIINKELHDQIDPLRDKTEAEQFGKVLPGQINQPPPEVLKNRLQGLQNFKTAAEQGHIPHIYYEMQLNSIAKSARAEHPGYREYIDEQISHITGGNPANNVIRELFQANAAHQGSKVDREQKLWDHFYTEGVAQIPGFNDWIMSRKNETGQPPSLDEMAGKINETMADRANTRAKLEEVRKAKESGALSATQLEDAVLTDLHKRYKDAFAANGPNWADLDGFQKNMTAIITQAGGPAKMTPQQFTLAQQQIAKLNQDIQDIHRRTLSDDLYVHLSAKGTKDAEEVTRAIKENLTAIFTDGKFNTGIAMAATEALKATQSMDERELMDGDQAWRMIAAIRRLAGEQTANTVLNWNEKLAGTESVTSKLKSAVANKMTIGLGRMFTGDDTITNAVRNAGDKVPGTAGGIVSHSVDAILSDATKPEGLANLVKSIYQDKENFLVSKNDDGSFIIPNRADRDKMFMALTSPAMVDRMQKLLKDGVIQPEHWEAMKDWVGKYVTPTIANEDIDILKATNRPENHFMVAFDPSTSKFVSFQNPNYHYVPGLVGNQADNDLHSKTVAQRLNTHLDALIRINEADGATHEQVAQKLGEFFRLPQINYDLGNISLTTEPEAKPGEKTQGRVEEKKGARPKPGKTPGEVTPATDISGGRL